VFGETHTIYPKGGPGKALQYTENSVSIGGLGWSYRMVIWNGHRRWSHGVRLKLIQIY